jgi:hypothetical protein
MICVGLASQPFVGVKRMDRRATRTHTSIDLLDIEQHTPADLMSLQQSVLDEMFNTAHRELQILSSFLLGKPICI